MADEPSAHVEVSQPRVSIVVASYNKEKYVAETIRSALCQGVISEVIVVDDASTDGSAALLRELAHEQPRMRLLELAENRGGAYCRNIGIAEARGEFVMFLDADDLLDEACCTTRVQIAEASPEHDLWVFPMVAFRDDPSIVESTWTPRPGDHLANFLAHRLDWSIMQPLWRRRFLESLGGFDASFVRLQDPELHVRALLAGARVRCHPAIAPDCRYRITEERHAADFVGAAERHVAGSLQFYRKFIRSVPRSHRHSLAGTMLAAIATVGYWRRTGRLDSARAAHLVAAVLDTCESKVQREVLRWYDAMNRWSPAHVPGLAWATRRILRA